MSGKEPCGTDAWGIFRYFTVRNAGVRIIGAVIFLRFSFDALVNDLALPVTIRSDAFQGRGQYGFYVLFGRGSEEIL